MESYINFGKLLKIYSRDITVNGADMLRMALGTYYKVHGDSNYATYEFVESTPAPYRPDASIPDRPLKIPEDTETDLRGLQVIRAEPLVSDDFISKIQINPARITEINPDAYVPNFKIPVRLYANPDKARGDKFWETYFKGGKFGDITYPALIDQTTVFYDTEIYFYHPYSVRELADFKDVFITSSPTSWKIQTRYNDYDQYVQKYQNWSSLKHELLLPNFNFSVSAFTDSYRGSDTASMQREKMLSYYYPNGELPGDLYEKNRWCGDSWIDHLRSNENLELEELVKQYQQNIMFDQNYYHYFDFESAGEKEPPAEGSAPIYDVFEDGLGFMGDGKNVDYSANMFNVTIEWDRHRSTADWSEAYSVYDFSLPYMTTLDTGLPDLSPELQSFRIRDVIENNNFSSKFLEILKDLDEGSLPGMQYNKVRYDVNQFVGMENDYLDPESQKLSATVKYMDFNTFDWMEYLTYMYNEYDVAINKNYTFMGPIKISHSTTYDDATAYRFYDNSNLLAVLDGTIDLTREYFQDLMTAKEDAMTTTDEEELSEISRKILDSVLSPVEKRHEVLAYKVEKIGGEPTGDSGVQNIIQKFWHFNSKAAAIRNTTIDTQVKYGQTYTYRGYAYVLAMSHKYKYSDFRLTKQIGVYDLNGDGNLDRYCVEFYDPVTMERSEQIFTMAPTNAVDEPTLSPDLSALSRLNIFATNGQDIEEYPQLADFHLNVEPCMKIIEVPIFEKTVVIQDNPPNNISVIPFHFLDNSHKLGFDMFADGFKNAGNGSGGQIYPIPITDDDVTKKTNYLNDKDLIETDYLPTFSESPARYIEMFRVTKKPTSFRSFDGHLVSRIDLRIPNEEFNRKDFIAADKINPGIKYYYVFRFVNENDMPGPLSPVLEAELHDDGGYIYSLFDTLDSSEFKPDPFVETSTTFKKIFQLEPNLQHLMLDASGADFSDYATNQINNINVGLLESKIWDKKFKIRLTSKKTGKKLDINVTYNIRERDLSPEITLKAVEDEIMTMPTEDSGSVDTGDPVCFVAGTMVATEKRLSEKIEQLKIGDSVIGFDLGGNAVEATVADVFKHEHSQACWQLKTLSSEVTTTEEHKFYVGNDKYVPVSRLSVGDSVMIFNDETQTSHFEEIIEKNLTENDEIIFVYNIHVVPTVNYFANNFAVHNIKGGGGDDKPKDDTPDDPK